MNRTSLRHAGAVATIGAVAALAQVEPAFAQGANIEGVLQNIVDLLTGGAARLMAIIAVVIVGLAWMFGYMDLRRAAYVVLGIAIVFGATEIVGTLTGGA